MTTEILLKPNCVGPRRLYDLNVEIHRYVHDIRSDAPRFIDERDFRKDLQDHHEAHNRHVQYLAKYETESVFIYYCHDRLVTALEDQIELSD